MEMTFLALAYRAHMASTRYSVCINCQPFGASERDANMGNQLAKWTKLDLRSHQTRVTMHALRMFSARQKNGPVTTEL